MTSRDYFFSVNVVSYPRYPGREPVTLTPTILEKQVKRAGGGYDKQIVIYASLAQGHLKVI